MRIFARALLLSFFAALSVPMLIWATVVVKRTWEDARFAHSYFSDRVSYDLVLASQRWRPAFGYESPIARLYDGFGGSGPPGCAFAVVRLDADATPGPPPGYLKNRGDLDWRAWRPTPGPEIWATGDSGLVFCKMQLGDDLFDEISDAIEKPGGWWLGGGRYRYLIYSKPAGIAYYIYQGD
ncbi:MAG: hypothetical protein AAF393_18960 [Pseudomonadota bacterium]